MKLSIRSFFELVFVFFLLTGMVCGQERLMVTLNSEGWVSSGDSISVLSQEGAMDQNGRDRFWKLGEFEQIGVRFTLPENVKSIKVELTGESSLDGDMLLRYQGRRVTEADGNKKLLNFAKTPSYVLELDRKTQNTPDMLSIQSVEGEVGIQKISIEYGVPPQYNDNDEVRTTILSPKPGLHISMADPQKGSKIVITWKTEGLNGNEVDDSSEYYKKGWVQLQYRQDGGDWQDVPGTESGINYGENYWGNDMLDSPNEGRFIWWCKEKGNYDFRAIYHNGVSPGKGKQNEDEAANKIQQQLYSDFGKKKMEFLEDVYSELVNILPISSPAGNQVKRRMKNLKRATREEKVDYSQLKDELLNTDADICDAMNELRDSADSLDKKERATRLQQVTGLCYSFIITWEQNIEDCKAIVRSKYQVRFDAEEGENDAESEKMKTRAIDQILTLFPKDRLKNVQELHKQCQEISSHPLEIAVPKDCKTLAEACQKVAVGGTIQLARGTHAIPETIVLRQDVTIIGDSEFPDRVVLEGEEDSIFSIASGDVTLCGLTIKNE